MKVTIENLRDTFQIGYDTYLDSRKEANKVEDYYHNRQYTSDQLNTLENRGAPKETFNIIKLFTRQLLGYYSTVVNTPKVKPAQYSDIDIASLLNDTTSQVLRENSFVAEGDYIKRNGLISGLFCSYINVNETGKSDDYGRPLYKIEIEHVDPSELVLDPMSIRADYTDARYIHRFKWLSEDQVVQAFGKYKTEKLQEYWNFLNIDEAEFEFKYGERFQGIYRQHDNYLIVHSIMEDDKGDTYSVYWCGDTILTKKKITYKKVKFPYRVVKLNDSNKAEYYGIFRDVMASQDAINQAVVQIQQMANSNKAFVQTGAVEDLDDFTRRFNRVNAVIPVENLAGIRLENLSGEIQQQYIIIDKAFDRIQRILGINDSFLGMAYASDSGRKVKLQQNASMVALRYITTKLEMFYRMVGWDVVHLIQQYYTANQVLRVSDETVGDRWIEINKPLQLPNPMTGQPSVVYDEDLDPASGEPRTDKEGNIILVPLNDSRTDISFADIDLEMDTNSYNDEDEKNQLMLETMLSGAVGNALMTVNPGGYFKAASLSVRSVKSKYSPDISQILEQTAQMLQPQPQQQENLGMANQQMEGPAGGPQSQMSSQLKLPQNTNEGQY